MAKKKETDPQALERRKKLRATKHADYMRLWRERTKKVANAMTNLLESAVAHAQPGPDNHIERGAVAALALTLAHHGITVNRIARTVSDGLDSTRDKKIGESVVSSPDMQHRLRASDVALKLLERAGVTPGARHAEPACAIKVNILVMGPKGETQSDGEMRTITQTDSESAGDGEDE
jgi:hypothetical protein